MAKIIRSLLEQALDRATDVERVLRAEGNPADAEHMANVMSVLSVAECAEIAGDRCTPKAVEEVVADLGKILMAIAAAARQQAIADCRNALGRLR